MPFFHKHLLISFQGIGKLVFSLFCSMLFGLSSYAYASDLILDIADKIHKYHISRPPRQAIPVESASSINAFLKSLDPHSKYLTQNEYRMFRIKPTGDHCGIGAEVSRDRQHIVLIPIQNGAAYKAGINQRQYLKSIDGRSTQFMAMDEIKGAILGPKGTVVNLGISNYFSGMYRDVAVTRRRFVPPSVELMIEQGAEYLRILQFIARRTTPRLRVSIRHLIQKDQPIILDLRDSLGGDLHEAIDALSLFLPAGTLICNIEDNQGENRLFYALPDRQIVFGKVLILVGPSTASAAELFVSVLKHYGRAVAIGQKTYGKCTSQKYFELSDGSALKLTNLKIYYPDGKHCDGFGLKPDISVTENVLYNTKKLISQGIKELQFKKRL